MSEADEPFPDARVNVVRVSRVGGRKQLTALSPVVAGPDGSFSIGRLSGAQYYLAAANPPSLTDTNQREIHSGKAGDERYVTTYYPSAIDIAGATLIDVRAEAEVRGLDIRLRRARVYHVAGKVAQAAGGAAANAMVTLIRPGITDATDPMGNASRYPVMDGVFQINGLLPGTYGLQAWAGTGRQLQGYQSVVLTDHDIDDVVVTVTPGLEIPLAVRIEGADAQESQAIGRTLGRFTLTATDGVNSNAMAVAKDDGTWIFHNIGAGTYRMGIGGADGTYVKAVRYGEKDVTRSELDTTAGGGALVAVLSTHAGEVAGALQSADGRPMTGTTVTLWMPGLPPPGTLDQARSTMTDEAGKFRFGNLAPGEYRVAAWEKIEPGLGNVAEFHRKFDAEATVVKVKEDGREKVQAPVISAKKVEEAAAGME
jgi:hypothetical protein